MKATTVGRLIAVTGVLLAAGFIALSMQESGNKEPPSTRRTANVVAAQAGSSSTGESERPPAVLSTSKSGTGSGQSRSMIEWQRDLYDPRTTAVTFAAAIEAAEVGDLTALREI